METTNSFAGPRMKERLFVMWQEAEGDPETAYHLWHKVRPLVRGAEAAPSHAPRKQAEKPAAAR